MRLRDRLRCWLGDHDDVLRVDDGRMRLVCTTCSRESAGFSYRPAIVLLDTSRPPRANDRVIRVASGFRIDISCED